LCGNALLGFLLVPKAVPCKKLPQGTPNHDLPRIRFSSLEHFRPPPNKSESKATYFYYLLQEKVEVKICLIRPKTALLERFGPKSKIGRLLESICKAVDHRQ
jgi:hypothetical protein